MRRLKEMLADLEKQIIAEGLKRTSWNKSRLAKELGISRSNLINKVKMYNLEKRNMSRNFQTVQHPQL